MFYLTLRDLVLYCFKKEKTAQSKSSFESPNTAVRIQHSVAMAAQDYTKHQFVFRYGVVFDILPELDHFRVFYLDMENSRFFSFHSDNQ